jgi:hypothetical protein
MKKARRLFVLIFMVLAFACFFVWGCATTPPATTPYNPVFKCSFKDAWDGVLMSLGECGLHLTRVGTGKAVGRRGGLRNGIKVCMQRTT